jgi:hypothetical protein
MVPRDATKTKTRSNLSQPKTKTVVQQQKQKQTEKKAQQPKTKTNGRKTMKQQIPASRVQSNDKGYKTTNGHNRYSKKREYDKTG